MHDAVDMRRDDKRGYHKKGRVVTTAPLSFRTAARRDSPFLPVLLLLGEGS
jgi:hypothetical protein